MSWKILTFKRSPLNQHPNRIFDVNQQYLKQTKLIESPTATTLNNNHLAQRRRKVSRIRQLASLKPVRHWFFDNLRNYCNSTSLHGFNYITQKGATAYERNFWITIVIISIIISIVLVIVSWAWNRATPTVTVIESAHFPTWNIPFPAVTICNFNKLSKSKAVNLAKKFKRPANVTEEQLLNLFRITLYFNFASHHSDEDFQLLADVLKANNYTINQLSRDLSPDCIEMISKCVWKGTSTRCDSLFQPVQSMEGVCCSFNYYGSATNNFPKKIAFQIPKQPYRVTGCGYATGISVVLNPITNDYFGTYLSSYGFRLLIHDAYNFPDENAETKVVTSGRESFVRISPETTYATNDVKKMDVGMRNCLFSNEAKLFAMQRYSFTNCMAECRANLIYKNCGCLPASLTSNDKVRICDLNEFYCVMKMKDIFSWALPTVNQTVSVVQNTNKFPCNCLPNCEFNNYPSEITMGLLDMKLVNARNHVIRIWFITLTGIIIVTHVVVINLIIEYLEQPTEIILSTQLKPIYLSPFPAVAVCSANKISRRKLLQYAEKVYEAQEVLQSGLLAKNVTEMAEHLLLFTGFFLYPFVTYSDDDPRFSKLHNILTSMYNGSEYPTREIIYQLSPDCQDIIIRGMIFGKEINVTHYFQKRSISAGGCCLFNYHRDTYARNDSPKAVKKNVTFASNTVLNSAQFVLQSDLSDFTYTEFASYAFQLFLFPQKDYPIVKASSMGEILVNQQHTTEILVQPTFFETTQSVRSFSPDIRKCYFWDEGQRLLSRSHYSLDECMLMCRMLNMRRYCGCVSPLLVPSLLNASACSLLQLPCLIQWMHLFNRRSYFYYIYQSKNFDICDLCLPICNGVDFRYYINHSPLREATVDQPYAHGLLKGLNSVKPLALIKLYFKNKYVESTKKDVVSDWVVLLNRFGGILSLFFGFSLMGFIEVLYFLTGKWFVLIIKAWNSSKGDKRAAGKKVVKPLTENPIHTLYWNELQPKPVKLRKYPKNVAW